MKFFPKNWIPELVFFSALTVIATGQAGNIPLENDQILDCPQAVPLGALRLGSGHWLVTPAEALTYQGEEGFNESPALRPRALMPVIDVIRPAATSEIKVKTPFAIEVQFSGQPDSQVNPATFKVFYGAFKLDITNRITKFVKVTESGFTLDNAQIPLGKHRLTLQIQDNKQRVAERELRFEVE